MANSKFIQDRWHVTRDGQRTRSDRYGKGTQYRARYRDSSGKQHSKSFAKKLDAQRWLDEITAAVVTGQYVHPTAGRVTFRDYAEQWRLAQVHRPSTARYHETMLRRHVYPVFGGRPIADVLPSHIQAWVAGLALQPPTVGIVHAIVAGIFRSAVRDRRIMANPCEGTRLPKVQPKLVEPWTTEQVQALIAASPAIGKAALVVAAGTGLRQGEILGLTVDRVDFLRRSLRVDRQLVSTPRCEPSFGPPKTAASVRTVPLPQVVIDALAAHLAEFPAEPDGLLFTTETGQPWGRSFFNHRIWSPARKGVGISAGGMHELRHYYASLLIRAGESVKTVQMRLGHATAAETLDTYSHLWPDADDRTREAVDAALASAGLASGHDNQAKAVQ